MSDQGFIGDRHTLPSDTRIAIVISRYNAEFCNGLLSGCQRALKENNIKEESVATHYVPGAFELPLAALWMTQAYPPLAAVIALGTIIRGETPHFEYVSSSCLNGLSQVAQKTGVPVTCGVLTVDTMEQAKQRSGENDNNRGYQATYAAFDMVHLAAACFVVPDDQN